MIANNISVVINITAVAVLFHFFDGVGNKIPEKDVQGNGSQKPGKNIQLFQQQQKSE